jgi:TcpE family
VELPTYTNIWKIEKRLYKLYDFRLPMPLPVGRVTAFLAIAVPYTMILTFAGMPFSHTWLWLYVLPPGGLGWLVTRPVLEGKRLPELMLSQLRYLSEPRTWCRMAPLAGPTEIFVIAKVWRSPLVPVASAGLPDAAVTSPPLEPVLVVRAGQRSGKPDHVQRDQARARLPLTGLSRIVVLGCTAGTGQTTTALLTGQVLSQLRGEAVAVLDLSPGPGSLTEQALIDTVVKRYPLTIADPAPVHVPRSLRVADGLVLVAQASAEAANSLAITLEWLDEHGYSRLARSAVTVLNGVSRASAEHVVNAVAVASGRCRAILRVSWDSAMAAGRPLSVRTVHAYTALARLIVPALADPSPARSTR